MPMIGNGPVGWTEAERRVIASGSLRKIIGSVEDELVASLDHHALINLKTLATAVSIGVVRALEEIEKQGGVAKLTARIEAERTRLGCNTEMLGERVPEAIIEDDATMNHHLDPTVEGFEAKY